MKIMGVLSDFILPSTPLGTRGLQCASGAIIGGTISKSWNTTATNVLAGGLMSMLSNRENTARNLGAAVTFSAITHAIDYYVPIHKLFAAAVGMAAASALVYRPAAGNIFTISIIGTALTYGPQMLEYIPLPVIHFAARSIAILVGSAGAFFMGGLVARGLLSNRGVDAFLFERDYIRSRTLLTTNAKHLLYNFGAALASYAVISAIDDSGSSYQWLVQKTATLGAIVHIGYHFLGPRRTHRT